MSFLQQQQSIATKLKQETLVSTVAAPAMLHGIVQMPTQDKLSTVGGQPFLSESQNPFQLFTQGIVKIGELLQ